MSQPGPVARRLAAADPAGLLYGAVISAATLTTVTLHTSEPARVAIATGIVLGIYWMTDLYVHALSVRFDGDTRGLVHRLVSSAAHKASVLKGGLPAIAVYLVADAAGADTSGAVYAALGSAIVLLTVAGYLGARNAGTTGRAAMAEGAGAGFLGVVVVIAKTLLH